MLLGAVIASVSSSMSGNSVRRITRWPPLHDYATPSPGRSYTTLADATGAYPVAGDLRVRRRPDVVALCGSVPLADGRHCLAAVEPAAGGEFLVEPVRAQRLPDLGDGLSLPLPLERPRPQTDTFA